MFSSHYVLEVISKERQQDLLREARRSRQAAASRQSRLARRSARGGPALAPVLLVLSRLLISAGESLRRAAYP